MHFNPVFSTTIVSYSHAARADVQIISRRHCSDKLYCIKCLTFQNSVIIVSVYVIGHMTYTHKLRSAPPCQILPWSAQGCGFTAPKLWKFGNLPILFPIRGGSLVQFLQHWNNSRQATINCQVSINFSIVSYFNQWVIVTQSTDHQTVRVCVVLTDVSADSLTVLLESCSSITHTHTNSTNTCRYQLVIWECTGNTLEYHMWCGIVNATHSQMFQNLLHTSIWQKCD